MHEACRAAGVGTIRNRLVRVFLILFSSRRSKVEEEIQSRQKAQSEVSQKVVEIQTEMQKKAKEAAEGVMDEIKAGGTQ